MNSLRSRVSMCGLALLLALVVGPATGWARPDSRVSAGKPIGPPVTVYNDSLLVETSPAAAYNSQRQEYLVVWYNDGAGSNMRAGRLSKSGIPIGAAFVIPTTCVPSIPDVAYNSQHDEYLVVWQSNCTPCCTNDYTVIAGQRVSGSGQLLGGELAITSFWVWRSYLHPAVAYASTSDRYLVVWVERNFGYLKSSIRARTVSHTGALGGPQSVVYDNSAGKPDVAYNRAGNGFLVVWEQEAPGPATDTDAWGRIVHGDGTPMFAAFSIGFSSLNETNPAVGALPMHGGQPPYLVAWELEETANDHRIPARLVNANGVLDPSILAVAATSADETHPAVVGNERTQQYLVTWIRPFYAVPFVTSHLEGRQVSPDLSPGPAMPDVAGPHTENGAALADGPRGDFLIVYDNGPLPVGIGDSNRGIYARLWGERTYLPTVRR